MPYVLLMQHAKAKSKEEDPERHITEEGKLETERIADFLAKKIKFGLSKIYHSPKTRSIETAKIIAKYFKDTVLIEDKDLEPLSDPKIWLERIKGLDENIAIVGHLPHLSKLLSLLIIGREDVEIVEFKYSCAICLKKIGENNWVIDWFIKPDLIS